MRAATLLVSTSAAPSTRSGPQRHDRRPVTSIRPQCSLLGPKSTGELRRRGKVRRQRRRRSTLSSSVVVASASASSTKSNGGDEEDPFPLKEASRGAVPESVSFQRTRGEAASSSSSSSSSSGDEQDGDPFRPGDLVEGRYRVEAVLGRGALGVTYAVRDAEKGETEASSLEKPSLQLALKATRLRGRGAGGWKAFDLAEREAAALKSLSGHPNIPRFEDFFDVDRPDDRVRCLVEERVRDGKPLSAVVASGERASPEDVARLARDILSALSHLSSRSPPVTHRDVKPENIVLEGGKWGERAFLVDFSGVAAASLAASESGGGGGSSGASTSSSSFPSSSSSASLLGPGTTVIGTFGFMAPEQFRGAASPSSDIYALGATLLFALTGRQPSSFPLRKGLRLDPGPALEAARAPRLLRELVEAALEPSPEDRPTADDALRAIEEALGESTGRRNATTAGGAGGAASDDRGEEEEEEGVVFSGRAFGGGKSRQSASSRSGLVDLERGLSSSSLSYEETSRSGSGKSGSSVALSSPSSSKSSLPPPPSASLTKPPPGARSKISTRGRSFAVHVPAGPLLAPERAGSAVFAVVWTASVAAWTATALAAGSLFAAAFSIPFWLSGAAVAKDALGGALSGDSRLEINPRTWKLVRGKRGGKRAFGGGGGGGGGEIEGEEEELDLPGAMEDEDAADDKNSSGGATATLRGARVAVTSIVNGVPRTRLEIVDGFNVHVVSEDLSPQEQRWLARAINAAVERATGRRPPLGAKKKKKRRDGDDSDSDDDDDDLNPPVPPRVFISDTAWGPSGFGVGGMWGDFGGGDFYGRGGGDDRFLGGNGGGFGGGPTDDGSGFVDDDF